MAEKRSAELSSLDKGLGETQHKERETAPCAQMVHAAIPGHLWDGVFFSWLSMKGHLQSLNDMERTEMFASRIGDQVHATFITVWTRREKISEWLHNGYPVDAMLRHMGVAGDDITVRMSRDYS